MHLLATKIGVHQHPIMVVHQWTQINASKIAAIVLHLDLIKASVRSVASKDIQPRVNFAANSTSPNPTWLLDSGTSHHVTADLNNLSLHSPYNGIDDVMIGNGTGLSITHTGSTTLSSQQSTFTLFDLLCVPTMKKKLNFHFSVLHH